LPHKVEFHVPAWSKETPKQYLVHFQQALDAIRQKGLLTAYETAINVNEECTLKLTKTTEAQVNYTERIRTLPKRKRYKRPLRLVHM